MYALSILIPLFLAIDAMVAMPIGAILGWLMILLILPADKEYDYIGYTMSLAANFVASVSVQHIFGPGFFRELYGHFVIAVCRDIWGPSHPSACIISAIMLVHKLIIDDGKLFLFDVLAVACTAMFPIEVILSKASDLATEALHITYTAVAHIFSFLHHAVTLVLSFLRHLLTLTLRLCHLIFLSPVLAIRAAGLLMKRVDRPIAKPEMVDAWTQTESTPEPPKLTFSEIMVVADIPPTITEEPPKYTPKPSRPMRFQKPRHNWLRPKINPIFETFDAEDKCCHADPKSSREYLRNRWAASKAALEAAETSKTTVEETPKVEEPKKEEESPKAQQPQIEDKPMPVAEVAKVEESTEEPDTKSIETVVANVAPVDQPAESPELESTKEDIVELAVEELTIEKPTVEEHTAEPDSTNLPEESIAPEDFAVPGESAVPDDIVVSDSVVLPQGGAVVEEAIVEKSIVEEVAAEEAVAEEAVVEETVVEEAAAPEDSAIAEAIVIPEAIAIPEAIVVPETVVVPEAVVVPAEAVQAQEVSTPEEPVVIVEDVAVPEETLVLEQPEAPMEVVAIPEEDVVAEVALSEEEVTPGVAPSEEEALAMFAPSEEDATAGVAPSNYISQEQPFAIEGQYAVVEQHAVEKIPVVMEATPTGPATPIYQPPSAHPQTLTLGNWQYNVNLHNAFAPDPSRSAGAVFTFGLPANQEPNGGSEAPQAMETEEGSTMDVDSSQLSPDEEPEAIVTEDPTIPSSSTVTEQEVEALFANLDPIVTDQEIEDLFEEPDPIVTDQEVEAPIAEPDSRDHESAAEEPTTPGTPIVTDQKLEGLSTDPVNTVDELEDLFSGAELGGDMQIDQFDFDPNSSATWEEQLNAWLERKPLQLSDIEMDTSGPSDPPDVVVQEQAASVSSEVDMTNPAESQDQGETSMMSLDDIQEQSDATFLDMFTELTDDEFSKHLQEFKELSAMAPPEPKQEEQLAAEQQPPVVYEPTYLTEPTYPKEPTPDVPVPETPSTVMEAPAFVPEVHAPVPSTPTPTPISVVPPTVVYVHGLPFPAPSSAPAPIPRLTPAAPPVSVQTPAVPPRMPTSTAAVELPRVSPTTSSNILRAPTPTAAMSNRTMEDVPKEDSAPEDVPRPMPYQSAPSFDSIPKAFLMPCKRKDDKQAIPLAVSAKIAEEKRKEKQKQTSNFTLSKGGAQRAQDERASRAAVIAARDIQYDYEGYPHKESKRLTPRTPERLREAESMEMMDEAAREGRAVMEIVEEQIKEQAKKDEEERKQKRLEAANKALRARLAAKSNPMNCMRPNRRA
ncbi:hypothetical protein F5Y04DRAFT_283544 [Hypomontagnella monticulosa]|nr:hypothetical protein F5Y04DRAFT_283544 [Hypomontagnella monticulosa]